MFDGQVLADMNEGGFAPFWVRIPAASGTNKRELVVVANNRFDDAALPGPDVRTPTQAKFYDFYQLGGIIRAVTLHILLGAASPFGRAPTELTTIGESTVDACSMTFIQRIEAFPLSDAGTSTPNGKVLSTLS
jgi:hypothetical protein